MLGLIYNKLIIKSSASGERLVELNKDESLFWIVDKWVYWSLILNGILPTSM